MQTDDICPGTTCFNVTQEENPAFERVKEYIGIIEVNTCSSRPDKIEVTKAVEMVKIGSYSIPLASCTKKKEFL